MDKSINDLPAPGEKLWYVIGKDAHEGPYSFLELKEKWQAKELRNATPIWARGWPEPLAFQTVEMAYRHFPPPIQTPMRESTENAATATEVGVTIRPVTKQEEIQRLQSDPVIAPWEDEDSPPPAPVRWPLYVGVLGLTLVGLLTWKSLTPKPDLVRPQEVSVNRYKDVQRLFSQITKPHPLPIAVVAKDYSKLWLIDRTTQECHYQVQLQSSADENLSGSPVSFEAQGSSVQHWILLDRLAFLEGQKLIPGRYRVNLNRLDCVAPGLARWWHKPDESLTLSFTVSLYAGPLLELESRLQEVARRKSELSKRKQLYAQQAWRDIEEKLRTLSAISQQIEQNFQTLLNRKFVWPQRVKNVVEAYTLKMGGFLTNFMVKNDEDFSAIANQDLEDKVEIMARQVIINAHAKRIGFVSMSLIEKLQNAKKAPARRDVQDWLMSLQQDFGVERDRIRMAAEEAQKASLKGQ